MFENKKYKGEYASRYIASWLRVGGQLRYGEDIDLFRKWLLSMGLTEDEVYEISNIATCGKLELQADAMTFLDERN